MIITYQSAEFFKVQQGDTVVAFNPVSKDSKLKTARFGANVVLVSAYHPDFNGAEQMSFGEKQPMVIEGPGEYETQGIFIKGFGGLSHYGEKELLNTSYLLNIEGMNLCFLGAMDGEELSKELIEAVEDIDILFVPIGGEGVLEPAEAYKIAVKLEPKVIIPMHYGDIGMKDALKLFLKEAGQTSKTEDKLTIKKKDLEGKEGEIIVLAQS